MAANVQQPIDDQSPLRPGFDALDQLAHRRQMPARKDILANKVFALGITLVPRLGHCDTLEHRNAAVRLEELVNGGKVRVEEFATNRFEHFDADNLVIAAVGGLGQGPVVAEQDFDLAAQARVRDALFRQLLLLFAQRQARYAAPGLRRGGNGKTTPARANLQDMVRRLDPSVLDKMLQLRLLGFFQGF